MQPRSRDPTSPAARPALPWRRDSVAGHDLRHAYATWLVTDGVPIGLVQRVMGHEQASTTLNRYTHTPDDYAARVLAAFVVPC
ncbi:hypothetical protein EAD96_16845 [Micromonospora sp. BL1]|nr:hypothetical protein EAD96_16845 [Micromonospora sp. BL1]